MSENLTIEDLKKQLNDLGACLQTLPERHQVSFETDAMFDKLSHEYFDMFLSIIDYLEQNR